MPQPVDPAPAPVHPLKQAFDLAWPQQPEAASLTAWRDAAQAEQQAARAWTPEVAVIELSQRSDRFNRRAGVREQEVGLAVPLWLPRERSRRGALADAQSQAVSSQGAAAQLRLAGRLREAYWQWQRARLEADAAHAQRTRAQQLAQDVARRVAAGDLAPADRHQAEAAVASAEVGVAQAEGARALAEWQWQALVGPASHAREPTLAAFSATPAVLAEADPASATASSPDTHPALADWQGRAAVAERSVALAAVQTRANPELMLITTREREAYGEPNAQSLTLGIRIPFGDGPRADARAAKARAEAAELQAGLATERARLQAEHTAARLRVDAARAQQVAAERRAHLAAESRGFFDTSFRAGETDLPTRLRIEREAAEAERDAALSRIDLAAAMSQWRQALGVLPQ